MAKFECCICGNEVDEWGNNPYPVVPISDPKIKCCDECNATKVIPVRLGMMTVDAALSRESDNEWDK